MLFRSIKKDAARAAEVKRLGIAYLRSRGEEWTSAASMGTAPKLSEALSPYKSPFPTIHAFMKNHPAVEYNRDHGFRLRSEYL